MDTSDLNRPRISPVFARRSSLEVASPNERQILDLLRRQPGSSRADLARAVGLTNQSLTRIIDDLAGRKLVRLGPSQARGRGQPSSPVYICPDGAYTAGISLMTDALHLGVMNFDGEIAVSSYVRLNTADVDLVLATAGAFIDRAFVDLRLPRERLLGAGIGITGYFIGDGAKVNPPPHLDSWALVDVAERFERALNLPIWLDNDGNVAAVGESLVGAGTELGAFAYLFFSAGFGGGLIIDRKLYRGAHGNAGEFASVLPDEFMSPNLENLRQSLAAKGRSFANLGDMLEAFDPEWDGVDDWSREAVKSLNLVISAISAIADLEAIVFGGRMPKSLADKLIPQLAFFNPLRRERRRPVPRLITSEARQDAAMTGAAALPLKALFYG